MAKNPYGIYPYYGPRNSYQPEPRPLAAFDVQAFSFNEIGGPRQATIKATGDRSALANLFDLLGCPMELRNKHGETVWWGRVMSVNAGNEGVSLDDMANSIAIIYTTIDQTGASTSATTTWLTDSLSITEYGTKQLLKTATSISADAAAKMQASALAVKKYPPVKNDISARTELVATITCRGEADTLKWQYYSASAIGAANWPGSGEYSVSDSQTVSYKAEPEDKTFQFGDASTSQYIRFGFKLTGTRPIQLKTLRLKGVKVGTPTDNLVVDVYGDNGSGSLGTLMGTVQCTNATIPTGSHAWFDVSLDDANAIVIPGVQYHFKVSRVGAMNGSNYFRLAANSALGYADGSSYTWNGSAWVTTAVNNNPNVASDILFELSASTSDASIGLNATSTNQRLAIPFQLGGSQDAACGTLQVEVARVGNPSGNLTGYVCSDSAGSPGAAVDYVSIACNTLSTDRTRISFNLPNNVLNSPSATLWLQLFPSYGTSGSDYIRVFTDPTNTYTFGATKAYNGSAWAAVSPVEQMWFEVIGMLETTTQIKNVVTSAGQFITSGAEVENASGVFTPPYRDGQQTALAVIQDLLKLGTSSGGVLLASVTKDKRLRIYSAGDSSSDIDNYYIDANNRLFTALDVPVDKTNNIAGYYIVRRDSLAGMSTNSYLSNATSYPVADVEYDVSNDYIKLTARGARDPFDIGVREG